MFRILNSCLLYFGKRINVMTVVFARIENSCKAFSPVLILNKIYRFTFCRAVLL